MNFASFGRIGAKGDESDSFELIPTLLLEYWVVGGWG